MISARSTGTRRREEGFLNLDAKARTGVPPPRVWQVTYESQESLQTVADYYFNVEINQESLHHCSFIQRQATNDTTEVALDKQR